MNRIELRIGADGCVQSLWNGQVDWRALGRVSVRRASHVEFCPRRQLWYVQSGQPRSRWRRALQWVLHRPCGEILHWARTREEALAWEQRYFGPGGDGWSRSSSVACATEPATRCSLFRP